MSKKILLTGGCGFVGSNLALLLKHKYPEYQITCLDNLRRRGSELSLTRLQAAGIGFVHGDIRKSSDFAELDKDYSFVIDASAEPSVQAGIQGGTDYVVETNFNGTIHCLNFCAECKADFLFLSTSRVYPINHLEKLNYHVENSRFVLDAVQPMAGVGLKGISESFPLDGYRSFYGSSKLASEYFIAEYRAFSGIRTVINRCGVIAGPHQMGKVDQGVVVLWMARHFWKKELNYIGFGGEGHQVRDVLHIADLFDLVDYQMHHMDLVDGQIWNAGGGLDVSFSLKELTDICEEISGNHIDIHKVAETRQADVPVYITDNTSLTTATSWKPQKNLQTLMTDVYNWIHENQSILKPILS